MPELSPQLRKLALIFQQSEVNSHVIYNRMADREPRAQNKVILQRIAGDELEHAGVWQRYSGREVKPQRLTILWYTILGFIFGYTFVIKLMEKSEDAAAAGYQAAVDAVPEVARIIEQENAHEAALHDMLDEERLQYVGAMVLGLNDALVELTGTIAGLTFAMANNRVVALAGIITGVSATLSMAASNYLAERADGNANAFKSSLYTGVAYLVTVICLVLPYLLFPVHMYLAALATMLVIVIAIIFIFNYYISVAKSLPFARRFWEMAGISLSVAVISFLIGLAAKQLLNIDV